MNITVSFLNIFGRSINVPAGTSCVITDASDASVGTVTSTIVNGVPQFVMPAKYADGVTLVTPYKGYKVSFTSLANYTKTFAFYPFDTTSSMNVISDTQAAAIPTQDTFGGTTL